MSFVPITGPATFRAADPPRDGVVEFTDHRRTISLPVRGALPVLARARDDAAAHPTVQLLAGSALLAMRLVAAGRFQPDGDRWRPVALADGDTERVQLLARARAADGVDEAAAEGVALGFIDAVVDTMPGAAPTGGAGRAAVTDRRTPGGAAVGDVAGGSDFSERLQQRIRRHRSRALDDRPQLVTLSLRVEADEEELVAGGVRLVLQVHAADNEAHLCDAGVLFTESGSDASHGFGDRARTHASIALRSAAAVWPVLDRLLELRVPDRITLDSDELLDFLDAGADALRDAGVPVLWPRYLDRDVTARVELGPVGGREEPLQDGLFGTADLLGFSWQLALHGETLSDDEMDRLATASSPVIKIRDQWLLADSATLRRARKRLIRTATPAAALAATLTGAVEVGGDDHETVVGATLTAVRDRISDPEILPLLDPPPGLAAELRGYQRRGLTWLAEMTRLGLGCCLADDMGLGKTITLIALHLHRHAIGRAGPTLVVCPASLLGNWEAEIRRFAPGVPVRRHHGSGRDLEDLVVSRRSQGDLLDQRGLLDQRVGFVLTTYGTMRNDAELLGSVPWDLVVADEAQHVKNPRSSTAKALRTIESRARVALTGTPVENNLTELWAILDWVVPGLLGSRNAFRKVWAAPIESGVEHAKTRQFADLVRPFLLRRRKSDPGIAPELPAKTETDHLIGLTREQAVLYESYVRDCMDRIERADEDARRGLVLKLLTGLKQICNHPAHFLRQADPRLSGRSEKLDLLDELLGTVLAEDGAALVFTQYVAMARLLETHLSRLGIAHQFLHGGTPVRQREAMVEAFQAGPERAGPPVFLLSLKAGGTGLNLTRADHVIHVDRWWNPAVEEQATDRAHRIGQTRPVQVHRFIAEGTIEERIAELLARKRSLADAVLARGETALTELDDAELRDLVELRPRG